MESFIFDLGFVMFYLILVLLLYLLIHILPLTLAIFLAPFVYYFLILKVGIVQAVQGISLNELSLLVLGITTAFILDLVSFRLRFKYWQREPKFYKLLE